MLKIMQTGFLGADPELRQTTGDPVCVIRVATTRRYIVKETGEKKEETTWVNWEIWGTSGENAAKYLRKGSRVYLEGSIRNHAWLDEDTKETRYRDIHRVTHWENLDRKPADEGAAGGDDNFEDNFGPN